MRIGCIYSADTVYLLSFPRDNSIDFYFSDGEIIFRGEILICKIVIKDKLVYLVS